MAPAHPRDPVHLGDALDAAVALGPEREAIAAEGLRLSYGELAREVDALAAQLRAAGVAPGERVAMVLPNVPELAIGFFAIARIGAVALPLHARAAEAELARHLAEGQVRFTLGTGQVLQANAALPSSPVPVDRSSPVLSQHSTGQSGLAKRVTRTHGQLLAEVASVAATLGITPADRILGVVPLFHAYGFVNALLCALTRGATLVLVDGSRGDLHPRHLLETLAAERVTGFPSVPFLLDALVATPPRRPLDLGALRYCTSAGAPLSPRTALAFAERFGVPVRPLYGTTEVGVVSVDRAPGSPGSVGFPVPGVDVTVVDEQRRPVPQGEVGDVAIHSAWGARGYDAAAEPSFVEGAFYPGDLGFFDPDGRLVLTGRKQRFVNVGGTKVDPVEVEEVLRAVAGVEDVAVIGVPDPISGERVTAVVVAPEGCDRAQLLAHCRAHLAPHKVPRTIQLRAEIPRSPLGKVLRRVLVDEETRDLP